MEHRGSFGFWFQRLQVSQRSVCPVDLSLPCAMVEASPGEAAQLVAGPLFLFLGATEAITGALDFPSPDHLPEAPPPTPSAWDLAIKFPTHELLGRTAGP